MEFLKRWVTIKRRMRRVSKAMADCPEECRRTSRRRNEIEHRSHSDPSEI